MISKDKAASISLAGPASRPDSKREHEPAMQHERGPKQSW